MSKFLSPFSANFFVQLRRLVKLFKRVICFVALKVLQDLDNDKNSSLGYNGMEFLHLDNDFVDLKVRIEFHIKCLDFHFNIQHIVINLQHNQNLSYFISHILHIIILSPLAENKSHSFFIDLHILKIISASKTSKYWKPINYNTSPFNWKNKKERLNIWIKMKKCFFVM